MPGMCCAPASPVLQYTVNMTTLFLMVLILLSVCLTAMSVAFRGLSVVHLRHWARRGDDTAKALYPLVARGSAITMTIELLRAFAISGAVVLTTLVLWAVLAWVVASVIFFVAFIVLSELFLKPFGIRLLVWFGRPLSWLSNILKPVTVPLGHLLDRFIADQPVVLTKGELSHLLHSVNASDTDLSHDELRILRHALTFGEKTVHDVMTPRSVMAVVSETEVLSPILLDELHKSGHSRFPVLSSDGSTCIGILFVRDLLEAKTHTKVIEIMRPGIHYVNEDRELDHVLQAFLKTKQHMFLVVNGFAEIVGLVTIEDVVEQVLGKPIIDEFDQYESMRQVANARAKVVRKQINVIE
jgi:CBS domain containing-hemolysin-like protein